MSEKQGVNRREFLATTTWAIGALLGAGFIIPAVAYVVGPALQEQESAEWIPLGSPGKIELGTPTLFKARVERQTGWIVNQEEISVYVLTQDGREFIAMSNICTHLGCRVRWIEDRDQFFCPCHNGIFDEQGSVVSGPAPKPLDRFEVKVEEEQLYLRGV
ncbi:MAG: ubiquinol-cytochrome c reductase iron-sulfur subunit [Anaerolineales bacterium]|jgi:menaquinol-cytochrome c reductase iron-sulfur subunit